MSRYETLKFKRDVGANPDDTPADVAKAIAKGMFNRNPFVKAAKKGLKNLGFPVRSPAGGTFRLNSDKSYGKG